MRLDDSNQVAGLLLRLGEATDRRRKIADAKAEGLLQAMVTADGVGVRITNARLFDQFFIAALDEIDEEMIELRDNLRALGVEVQDE